MEGKSSQHILMFSSVSVVSDSLQLHGLQHARLPCPSPNSRACSNSCALIWCCHPAITSSVVPFCSCLQFFQASAYFPMAQLFFLSGWPKYWSLSLSFSISPPDEYSELSSFRIVQFYLLVVLPFLCYVIGTDRF